MISCRRLFGFHQHQLVIGIRHFLPSQPKIRQLQFGADLPHGFCHFLCKGVGRINYGMHAAESLPEPFRVQPSHMHGAVLSRQNFFPVCRSGKGGDSIFRRQCRDQFRGFAGSGNDSDLQRDSSRLTQ